MEAQTLIVTTDISRRSMALMIHGLQPRGSLLNATCTSTVYYLSLPSPRSVIVVSVTEPSLLHLQVPRPPYPIRKDKVLERIRSVLLLQGRNVQIKFNCNDPYVSSPSKENPRSPFLTCRFKDLAKSLMALDERKDLLHDWEGSGSVLEIIFL